MTTAVLPREFSPGQVWEWNGRLVVVEAYCGRLAVRPNGHLFVLSYLSPWDVGWSFRGHVYAGGCERCDAPATELVLSTPPELNVHLCQPCWEQVSDA